MFVKYTPDYLDGNKLYPEFAEFLGVFYHQDTNRVSVQFVEFDEIVLLMNEIQYYDFVKLIESCILDRTKLLTIEGKCFILNEGDEVDKDILGKTPCIYTFLKDGVTYI